MFRDAILGNDLSDYSDEQQADVVVAIEVLEKALSSASSLIDSYLMRSYSLPLITYPEWITEACVSLANCSLHDDNTVEPIREKCTYYTKLLEAVASGKLKLYPVTSEDVTVSSISKIAVKASDRVFTDALFSKIL